MLIKNHAQAIEKTTHLQSEKDLQNFKPYFECDLPNTNLYEFNGSIQLEPGTKKFVQNILKSHLENLIKQKFG